MSVSAANLDDKLIPVDNLGKRWAKWGEKRPDLHPLERMRLLHDGAVLGGGPSGIPEDIAAWDVCIEGDLLEQEHKVLLKLWYTRQGMPATTIADRLRISRVTLYKHRSNALYAMLTALKIHGVRL